MNEIESKQFVSEVLKGFWSRWEPNDEELRAWIIKLKPYDYERAKTAVRNLFFTMNQRMVEPPAGKIIKHLNINAVIETSPEDEYKREPGKIYGKEARDTAFANILNGPDNKTRRWLVEYLEKKYPDKDGPVKIGDAIKI